MGRPCVAGASGARDRPASARTVRVDGTALARGRPDRDRRHHRRGHDRRRAARRARDRASNFEHGAGLGGRAPHARRARQRRHARGRRQGARVRRRGHRPLPHRAHVHGRRPPAEDARDDHGRRPRRTRRAALDELLPLQQQDFEGLFEEMAGLPVTIRLLDPPLHEFLPGARGAGRRSVERARIERTPTTSTSSSRRSSACTQLAGDEPDARHARLPARRSSTRRSTRCRCARSCGRRSRSASARQGAASSRS